MSYLKTPMRQAEQSAPGWSSSSIFMAAAAGTSTALENYLTTQTLPRLSHMTESFGPESSSAPEKH